MAEAPKPSLGYPHVEKLIDSEDFEGVNHAFQKCYVDLEKIAKAKRGLGKAKEAKKAMRALEKCSELLKNLLQIKYQLHAEISKQASAKGGAGKKQG